MVVRPENPRVKESMAASFTPADSPLTVEDYMASATRRQLSTPDVTVGELAADFALPIFDFSNGVRRETGESFHLLAVAANQPVALIFGSYT
jgi:hypothetical protein